MSSNQATPETEPTKAVKGELVTLAPAEIEILETRIAHAEKMANALDTMRALAIKRTVPGDWQRFGQQFYLEGDGAARIAPVIGLVMSNVKVTRELVDGVYRVGVSADFRSTIFGTFYPNVQRTRSSDDEFLTQKGNVEADLGDLENAAYKGCLARGAALAAGISGLSAEDLWARFGIKVDANAVDFQKGAATAQREGAKGGAAEADRILHKLCEGDEEAVGAMLFKMTDNPAKGYAGSRKAKDVRPGAWAWLLPKLVTMENNYDAAQEKGLPPVPPANGTKK